MEEGRPPRIGLRKRVTKGLASYVRVSLSFSSSPSPSTHTEMDPLTRAVRVQDLAYDLPVTQYAHYESLASAPGDQVSLSGCFALYIHAYGYSSDLENGYTSYLPPAAKLVMGASRGPHAHDGHPLMFPAFTLVCHTFSCSPIGTCRHIPELCPGLSRTASPNQVQARTRRSRRLVSFSVCRASLSPLPPCASF